MNIAIATIATITITTVTMEWGVLWPTWSPLLHLPILSSPKRATAQWRTPEKKEGEEEGGWRKIGNPKSRTMTTMNVTIAIIATITIATITM